MNNERITRSIVAVDLKGNIYSIHEYVNDSDGSSKSRFALEDGTPVDHSGEAVFVIPSTGVDLRAIY